jgi:hypothetical protein
MTHYLSITLLRVEQTRKHGDGCGLPSPIWTKQAENLTLLNFERDSVYGFQVTEALVQILHPYCICHHYLRNFEYAQYTRKNSFSFQIIPAHYLKPTGDGEMYSQHRLAFQPGGSLNWRDKLSGFSTT